MNNKRKTLPMQLLIAISLCVSILISSIFFLVMTYRGMIGNITRATQVTVEYVAETVNQSVNSTLAPSEVTLKMLRWSGIGQAETLQQRLAFVPVFAETLKINPIGDSAYIGYQTGEFYLLRRYEPVLGPLIVSAPSGTHFLLQTKTLQADGSFEWRLWFFDEKAQLLGDEVTTQLILDPRERIWFTLAQEHDGIITSRPYVYFDTKEVGVSMAQKTPSGNAVVGFNVTIGDLSELLGTLLITPNTKLVLVDDAREIVAYPGIGALKNKTVGPDGAYELSALEQPVLNTILDAQKPKKQVSFFNYNGKEWFGLAMNLDSFYGNGLRMIIAIPGNELLKNLHSDLLWQGIIALVMLCLILVVGWRFGKWLAAPLHLLTQQVKALSSFDFDAPIGVRTRTTEVAELGNVLKNMALAITGFRAISRCLNRERNLEKMIDSVLHHLLQIVHLKQGAVYLYEEKDKQLHLIVEKRGKYFAELPVKVNIKDDEELKQFFTQTIGDGNVYALLRNREHDLIGLLCLTCDENTPVDIHDPESPEARYIDNIAGAVAVAIETRQLIHMQKALLEGLIKLIADAIDTKSIYTGGHCRRVPELSLMLLQELTQCGTPPFEDFTLNKTQSEEFRIAAWLHDCGKITTPEYVVDKATKLETIFNRLHEIRTRFEVLYRDASIRHLQEILDGGDPEAAKLACLKEQEALQDDFAFIANCNIGGETMDQAAIDRLRVIAQRTWLRHFDDRLGLSREELVRMESQNELAPDLPAKEFLLADKPWHIVPWKDRIPPVQKNDPHNTLGFDMKLPEVMYNYGELYNLSVKRGTLTEEERFKINDHIVQTLCMLSSLPFPKSLAKVPSIASNHHETLIGTGYPRKLEAKELDTSDRIIAVADVFEALTASDRPYKDGKTLREALGILAQMARKGHIDGDIFNVMLRSGVYLKYARKHLHHYQIDLKEGEDISEFLYTEAVAVTQ